MSKYIFFKLFVVYIGNLCKITDMALCQVLSVVDSFVYGRRDKESLTLIIKQGCDKKETA